MSELDEQIANRHKKLAALKDAGVEPYPHRFDHDLEPSGVQQRFAEQSAEELEQAALSLRVPGRVSALRSHGKTSSPTSGTAATSCNC